MGEVIVPGQGPSVEDILFKYIFELDNGQIGSLGEDLSFVPSGKNIGVSVAGAVSRSDLPVLFGVPYSGGFYWDAKEGKIVANPSTEIASIYGIGKYSPDTGLLSMQDVEDAGEKFRYAGAGEETWENASSGEHRAYGIGHETMLRNLMNIPAVANLVQGKDPRTGNPSSSYTNTIKNVLYNHKNEFGGRHAFSTLPKLMTFLVNVYAALEEDRKKKGKGARNPLRQLFLSNSDAANQFANVLSKGGYNALNNVLLRREGDETDEEFYKRQLAEINRQREKEGRADRSYRQYCNWVIDRMVRNIYAAAKALEGKQAELQRRRENSVKFIVTDPKLDEREKDIEGKRKALSEEYKGTFAYMRGAASAISRMSQRVEWAEGAMRRILQWEKDNSLDSRAAAIRDKQEKAEALLSSVREEHKPFVEYSDAERRLALVDGQISRERERLEAAGKERLQGLEKERDGLQEEYDSTARKRERVAGEFKAELDRLDADRPPDYEARRQALSVKYAKTQQDLDKLLARLEKRLAGRNRKVEEYSGASERSSAALGRLLQEREEAKAELDLAREKLEQASLGPKDVAVRKLTFAQRIRDDIVRQAKTAMGYLGKEDGYRETRRDGSAELEAVKKELAELPRRKEAVKEELKLWSKRFLERNPKWRKKRKDHPKEYWAALDDAFGDQPSYLKARRDSKLLRDREAELERMVTRAVNAAVPPASKSAYSGSDAAVGAVVTFLGAYKHKQEERLKEFRQRDEYLQAQDRIKEHDERLRSIDKEESALKGSKENSRQSGLAEMRRLNPVARVMLYQMAISRGDLKTLDQLLDEGGDMAPLSNSSMKMVAAGVLLGDTGMELEEVKAACEHYFQLRASPGADSENAAAIFQDLFGVDPTRIPSDERIKDFHRGWKRIEDVKESSRRIAEAVDRRFF